MITGQFATHRELMGLFNNSTDKLSVSLTTTKQELRSTVDHARDRIIEKLYDIHREQTYAIRMLMQHYDAVQRTNNNLEHRLKELERLLAKSR